MGQLLCKSTAKGKVRYFWDYDNTGVLDIAYVISNLRAMFGEGSFLIVGNEILHKIPEKIRHENDDVSYKDTNGRNKDDGMLKSPIFGTDWNDEDTMVLITDDGDFQDVLDFCAERNVCSIVIYRRISRKLEIANAKYPLNIFESGRSRWMDYTCETHSI
uniref:NYN domain-containing protein n=1 Tax=Plectus sambesii TaxID=2011161 RepID=A0A914UZ02_9BILA